MASLYEVPPMWAKTAVPTARGWADPKTGELLVSIKLDMSKFEKPSKTVKVQEVQEQPKEQGTEEVQEQPTPKTRGRKPAAK